MLDAGQVCRRRRHPYSDVTFDLVFVDNVLEHLPDPLASSVRLPACSGRVESSCSRPRTKPTTCPPLSGSLRTAFINSSTGFAVGPKPTPSSPASAPTHTPTYDASLLPAASPINQLDCIESRPEYLRITWPTYLLGAVYERLVNGWDELVIMTLDRTQRKARKEAEAEPGVMNAVLLRLFAASTVMNCSRHPPICWSWS